MNLYQYADVNPINRFDFNGLSPEDVQKILNEAKRITAQMTRDGHRTDPGVVNNLSMTCAFFGICKNDYWGCRDQSDELISQLQIFVAKASLDDNWTFVRRFRPIHYYVIGKSDNKCDPELKMDPWHNIFKVVK